MTDQVGYTGKVHEADGMMVEAVHGAGATGNVRTTAQAAAQAIDRADALAELLERCGQGDAQAFDRL